MAAIPDPDPATFVIFGVTGDLSQRLLLPALFRLYSERSIPEEFAVVGVARKMLRSEEFRKFVKDTITKTHGTVDEEAWQRFASRLYYTPGDFSGQGDHGPVALVVQRVEQQHRTGGNRVFYLATPPSTFEGILTTLHKMELVRPGGRNGAWNRVIIEKPFGQNQASARELNMLVDRVIGEDNIFRIDHYLGKETVQNMLVLRFANTVFEPIWDRRYVDHVQITFVEEEGIGGRGRFYEEVGVVRDVVQNHVFQLLAIIAMEPPAVFDAEGFRNEKAKVLRAIPPIQPEDAVRGQYGPGEVRGNPVPGYRQEEGISDTSLTPTYAAMRLAIDNWRWAGVPFYLRAGKRLHKKDTEVVVVFRQPPLRLFKDFDTSGMDHNVLVLNTTEEEKISLTFGARVPGHQQQIRSVALDFDYARFGPAEHAPYEHLLLDVLRGVRRFFPRRDEVELQWTIVDPLLEYWDANPPDDFPNYPAGSQGPASADALLQRDGRHWRTG
ncbi:MAG: glucose-6-phosphate dehydrogenase [bacterium]|jgi:glucose-6-phosphate 1-dehydrogenase